MGAQTTQNTSEETRLLLSWRPDRLGHATFISNELKNEFFAGTPEQAMERNLLSECEMDGGKGWYKPCIEICLTSNLQ